MKENYVKPIDGVELVTEAYKEYAHYVNTGRAAPNLIDGAKSVYKRLIYGCYKLGPRHKIKSAELCGYALKYHPHPEGIYKVVCQVADLDCKFKLFDTQGLFGGKGATPAASRYTDCMLSDLAIDIFCEAVDYCEYEEGEIGHDEPVALPTFLQLCYLEGAYGIPVGAKIANIPALNSYELIDYIIKKLEAKDLDFQPKNFPTPNCGDVLIISEKNDWNEIMRTGKGKLLFAPIMNIDKDDIITIQGLPEGKDIESVLKILDKEITLDKVDVRDESGIDTKIVVEKVHRKQCNMKEVYQKLYKKLQSSETYNFMFFRNNKIIKCGFDYSIRESLKYLIETYQNKLTKELEALKNKLLILETIEKIKKEGNIKELVSLTLEEAANYISKKHNVDIEIAKQVLSKPISYLTKEHKDEIDNIKDNIKQNENNLSNIYDYMIEKYKNLKNKIKKVMAFNYKTKFIESESPKKQRKKDK